VGWTAALLFLAALPGTAAAAGYGIYEQGAAVLGMAGAGTASVSDASAVFFNPAALTRLEGRQQIYVGGSLLTPSTSFAGVAPYPGYGVTEEMERQFFPLPAVYYARRVGERWAAGLGFNAPYGLGVEWKDPDQFTGRYIVTKANLMTGNLGLSAAYAVNPMVSMAVGGNIMFTKVKLHQRVQRPVPPGGQIVDVAEVVLESDIEPGYGWNAAVSIVPNERWSVGAYYRGKVITKPDGDADFTQIPTGDAQFDAAVAASLPPDQGVSTVLRLPAIWSLGVAWRPQNWKVEADLVFTEWSLFTDLPVEFDQTPQNNEKVVEEYDDALAIRLGVEHRLEAFTYRFGYYFEQEAAPSESVSPILPDAARHGATLGLGWGFGADKRWTLDLYDLALFVPERSTEGVNRDDFNGTYKTFINSAGFNVGYHW
jgi:long-chain fatty acid transport protein